MTQNHPYITSTFALVICRNHEGKWLCVNECDNQGWWIAGGFVEPNESLYDGAKRETLEEAGIEIEIKGILRIEHSARPNYARMRVIFFAEPKDKFQIPKSIPDNESLGAAFLSLEEILELRKYQPGWRGEELYNWPKYLENGGLIAPLNYLTEETNKINLVNDTNSFFAIKKTSNIMENEDSNLKNIAVSEKEFVNLIYKTPIDVEKIKHSLINGFNPNIIINEKLWSPLHYAIKLKNLSLMNLLLLHGADISHNTHRMRNTLNFAVQENKEILNLLLIKLSEYPEENIKKILNEQDLDDGDTSLHTAARLAKKGSKEHFEIFKILVNYGANEMIRNFEDNTAVEILNPR